jgi:hypothetical protein
MTTLVAELQRILATERAKVLKLPPLPLARQVNQAFAPSFEPNRKHLRSF